LLPIDEAALFINTSTIIWNFKAVINQVVRNMYNLLRNKDDKTDTNNCNVCYGTIVNKEFINPQQ